MKKQCALIICFCIAAVANAQNLVPNPSFENINNCPQHNNDYAAMQRWFRVGSTSVDFYNACATSADAGVPQNFVGYQQAQHGDGYAGILLYLYGMEFREYISVKLTQPLQANEEYCVSYYVSQADSAGVQAASVGAYFGDSLYMYFTQAIARIPQVQNPATNFIGNATGWTLIEGSFVAQGGERYITIGNFNKDPNTPFGPNGILPDPTIQNQYFLQSYIYIDNVTVEPCKKVGIAEDKANQIQLYPNPAVGFITVETPANYTELQLEVYSLTGALVYQTTIKGGVKNKVNLTALAGGMYVAQVLNGNTILSREKVLVTN